MIKTWAAKRFWTDVKVANVGDGYQVHLDGRPVHTPGKTLAALPNRAMADAMAAEWAAQADTIAPATMPITRLVTIAIDHIVPNRAEVAAKLAAYGETDLLCYRAAYPPELSQRQITGWDPILTWAAGAFDAQLLPTTGVQPITQPPNAIRNLHAQIDKTDTFPLAALRDMVMVAGSLILGLAAAHGRLTPDVAFDLSRIDEEYQIEHWGNDTEAETAMRARKAQFVTACRFFRLSNPDQGA